MCVVCGPDRADMVVDHGIDHPFELKGDTDFECSTCGRHVSVHPDKMEFLAKWQMETISEHGHQVRGVFGEQGNFAYSIGRTVKDRPELLVTGVLPLEVMQSIINNVAAQDDESPVRAGDELDEIIAGGYTVRLVAVRDMDEAQMFGVTNNFGTDDTSALQILWPDSDGHFPGDPGYDTDLLQPVFAATE